MRKLIISLMLALTLLSCTAFAAEKSYDFEDGIGDLSTVTNTLGTGGTAVYADNGDGKALSLDGSYGLKLGSVDGSFSVSVDVKISSLGSTKNLFFKNMGSSTSEKWTGVIFANGVPTVWRHDNSTYKWSQISTTAESCADKWVNIIYTEDNGTASLYVDKQLVSTGTTFSGSGTLYLGTTYWVADTLEGLVDNLVIYDSVLSEGEISFPTYEFSYKNIVNDIDLSEVPGGSDIVWSSDNESVLSSTGKVNRTAEDTVVTLTGTLNGVTRSFTFTVLGTPTEVVNDEILLSYDFKDDTTIAVDRSGNGNHGVIHGSMQDGYFDGSDDYVEMPQGTLNGLDSFSIVMRLTPEIAKTHQFTFCFGNSTSEYFFLNTSRPSTNTIRLAITEGGSTAEKDITSLPGLRSGESYSVVVTAEDSLYKLYVDGILVASGDMGLTVSDLGDTTLNYIAKSPYSADALFKGQMDEFTIYTSALTEEEIYNQYYVADEDEAWFFSAELNEAFSGELNRDCVVAASFYDADGSLIYSTTKKVSDDDLTVELDARDAVFVEVSAFDAATGIVGESFSLGRGSGIVAYSVNGGCVKLVNTSNEDEDVVVINAAYNAETISSIDAVTATVEANSFTVVPIEEKEGGRVFVWTSLAQMLPVTRK